MKYFIVFAALVAVALARVPRRRQASPRALYAEPARAASKVSPPVVLYGEPAPAASQEAPAILPSPIAIIKETLSDNIGLDSYRFSYEQSDSQRREESAQVVVRSNNPEHAVLRVEGYYSYVGDDGQTYTVTYIADENGFQPQGAHLPVAPVA